MGYNGPPRPPTDPDAVDVVLALRNWPNVRITDQQERALQQAVQLTIQAIEQTGDSAQIERATAPGLTDWTPLPSIRFPERPSVGPPVYPQLNDQVLPLLDQLARTAPTAVRSLYAEAAAILRQAQDPVDDTRGT